MARKRKRITPRPTNKPGILDELRTNPARKLSDADRQRIVDELRADPERAAAYMAGEWRDARMEQDWREAAAKQAPSLPVAQRGRPRVHDWPRIVVEVCWHLSGKGPWGELKRDDFLPKVQQWSKHELRTTPSLGDLKRVYAAARKRFVR